MPLVFAAIAPHGWPTIPALSDDAAGAMLTRQSLMMLSQRAAAAGVDVVVIVTPHGMRVGGAIAVADVARGSGILRWDGRQVEMSVPIDSALTNTIVNAGMHAGIPVVRVGFGGSERPQSVAPLDWGTMTPLWFLGHDRDRPGFGDVNGDPPADDNGPSVVIVTSARDIDLDAHIAFGEQIGAAAERDPRRVAVVASCDWAHSHATNERSGHPSAPLVDAIVVDAVKANDLLALRDLDPQLIAEAAIDGLWQALMLAGALNVVPMPVDFISYEAPPRYATGMLVATFSRFDQ